MTKLPTTRKELEELRLELLGLLDEIRNFATTSTSASELNTIRGALRGIDEMLQKMATDN